MTSDIGKLVDGREPEVFDLVLLANFIHQVVNPLNGVAGTLDNLAAGTIKGEHRKEQRMHAARAQLEQCITLMRNLAFLAQGFNKVAEVDTEIVVLPKIIIEAAMFFQEDGFTKNIAINLEDDETQNRVTVHPELLRQVLMNIFDNCVKYSEPGYPIEVNQWIQKGTSNAMISIKSRSKYPVDPTEIDSFFKLGFRGTNAKKVVASGTGLGLYICKRIVEDVHGGSLHMQTIGRQEIEFIVKLPNGQVGERNRGSNG